MEELAPKKNTDVVVDKQVKEQVKKEAKDATQISEELNISLSSVYKTVSTLEDLALLDVEKYVISKEGKKIKLYRSRIGKVEITMKNMEPVLHLYPVSASDD